MKRIGEMRFYLNDERDSEFNESVDCTFALYGKEYDEIMNIEKYWTFCRFFASAMGFPEEVIKKYFGEL